MIKSISQPIITDTRRNKLLSDLNMIERDDSTKKASPSTVEKEEQKKNESNQVIVEEDEDDDDWIQLSFDGATFTTTRSTLTMDKDSMLHVMFQKNSPFKKMTRDFNHPMKPYFVMMDRNPQYFEPILNYLRSGELVINKGVNIRGVHLESKFWGLASLTEEIEKLLELERLSELRQNLHDNLECELTRQDIVKALLNCPSGKGGLIRLQGLNLPGIDLSGLDLTSVNFSKTNLKNANLSRCTLDFSEMKETIIEGCNFSNARMFKVIIKNANCKNVNLSGASLRGASITHCDLTGANFNSSDLELADLSNSNLRNADLSGASMKGVTLKNCVTTNVTHTSAMGGVITK